MSPIKQEDINSNETSYQRTYSIEINDKHYTIKSHHKKFMKIPESQLGF